MFLPACLPARPMTVVMSIKLGYLNPCLPGTRRVKKANEKRLEQKKMQSQKKGDRRGKIDY